MTAAVPTDQALSDGVVAYLAYGDAASWRRRPEAVPEEIRTEVEAVVAEADSVRVDWDDRTLGQAGDLMRDEMARRHPELSADALAALRWKWTFDWR
ncbi:hypothetical protein ACXR2U_12120 [Jatrophihabitans sp. YIM 134969]